MVVLLLALLGSWPVSLGEAVLREWHSYDLLRCDVVAEPVPGGLKVSCLLALRVERPGPLRFLLSSSVSDLRAEEGGTPVPATLGGEGLAHLVKLLAPEASDLPALLTLSPTAAGGLGQERKLRIEYLWSPSGEGFSYADSGGIETHLSGFWVPTMADERFDASLRLVSGWKAVSLARMERSEGETRFESEGPVQVLAFAAGPFLVYERGHLEVLLPEACEADPSLLLDDLAAVLSRLEEWFGPCGEERFRLVVAPRARPSPSYCAGAFAVVHPSMLPAVAGRTRWIDLLAHECSHRWWGHRVATPVLGYGGTWLREGLAQWSGIRVAGALLGPAAERDLWRANARAYLGRLDLRRASDHLFANEATLLDATYLDDAVVPYCRGALVHRRLAERLGASEYLARLRRFSGGAGVAFVRAGDYAGLLGLEGEVAYYAGTTRLPDFALDLVQVAPGTARARVRCLDPLWPDAPVPCHIVWEGGATDVEVSMKDGVGALSAEGSGRPLRIEIDPERVLLDPVGSNGVWVER